MVGFFSVFFRKWFTCDWETPNASAADDNVRCASSAVGRSFGSRFWQISEKNINLIVNADIISKHKRTQQPVAIWVTTEGACGPNVTNNTQTHIKTNNTHQATFKSHTSFAAHDRCCRLHRFNASPRLGARSSFVAQHTKTMSTNTSESWTRLPAMLSCTSTCHWPTSTVDHRRLVVLVPTISTLFVPQE